MLISKFKELIYFTHCVHYNTLKFVNVHGKKGLFSCSTNNEPIIKKNIITKLHED